PGRHHRGRGGRGGVAGGAVPPRRWGGAPAAALGGLGGHPGRAGGGGCPRRRGAGGYGRGHLGDQCLFRRPAGGDRGRPSCATGSMTWTTSSAAPWPGGY